VFLIISLLKYYDARFISADCAMTVVELVEEDCKGVPLGEVGKCVKDRLHTFDKSSCEVVEYRFILSPDRKALTVSFKNFRDYTF
jgi:hypothetical protein